MTKKFTSFNGCFLRVVIIVYSFIKERKKTLHLAVSKHGSVEALEHRGNEELGGGVEHIHLGLGGIEHAVERVAVAVALVVAVNQRMNMRTQIGVRKA